MSRSKTFLVKVIFILANVFTVRGSTARPLITVIVFINKTKLVVEFTVVYHLMFHFFGHVSRRGGESIERLVVV